jgi:hypothetical protein
VLKGDRDAAKLGFIHSLGHGVGLTIGERPYLSLFSDERLRKNQVVTVEPGLYEPGVGASESKIRSSSRRGVSTTLPRWRRSLRSSPVVMRASLIPLSLTIFAGFAWWRRGSSE